MFHAADAALLRAASYPRDLTLPDWPDLTVHRPDEWLKWLSAVWALPEFAKVVEHAAPSLAAQVSRALDGDPVKPRALRRLVEAAVRYLLRWTTRPTPFGHFAGVAPVLFGARASVRWGEQHHDVARPDERDVARHTSAAENDLLALRTVMVVTNSLGYVRGGVWVLPCARADDERRWDIELPLTDPVRVAIEAARTPVPFSELAAKTAGKLHADLGEVEALVAALVQVGALLSQIRPPMTVTDPADHLARHVSVPDAGEHPAVVDRRLDCSVTLPPAVIAEAQNAASALVAVAPPLPGWDAYRRAFIERWGPGVAVPLRETLNVLGFPAGYRGSTRNEPIMFTARDALLIDLAQRSALDGGTEVVLDNELITALRGDDDRPPIPHTELRFTLAAATLAELDRGAFTLTVVSGARHAGVAAGRFLYLLTPTELARFRSVYAELPTVMADAEIVQLSGPPLDVRMAAVARTPELFPIVPTGDFHLSPRLVLDDLAVAADHRRLWLVSRTTGRPVEPLLLNCVRLPHLQQPLVRFLAEIWTAWTAPCTPFDWGHAARKLAFLPRVRRGRSILRPARWIIPASQLPARTAPWSLWRADWSAHREHLRLPDVVLLGADDVRLRLDLNDNAHLAVLRNHLDRHPTAVLTEAPEPSGWIDNRPAELLLTLTHQQPSSTPLRPARSLNTIQHRPGQSRWLDAYLYGHVDHILTRLPGSDLPSGWWFLRYPEPEPHLRLRIPLRRPAAFANATRDLALVAEQLHEEGVLSDYSLHTYRPETRHGTGATLSAAEAVFAADSRAALKHLHAADRQAAAASGMLAIAHGFTTDGARWLVDHAPHRGGSRLDPAQLTVARRPYGDDGLAEALAAYRRLADRDGLDADQVLADLLHLHHARMIGVGLESERHCLRLARAVARTDLARRSA